MAGIIRKLTGIDELRKELRERVEQLLNSSHEWVLASKKLSKDIKSLEKTVKKFANELKKL